MALVIADSVYHLHTYYDKRWFGLLMALLYFPVRRLVRNLSRFYSIATVMVAYLVIATIYAAGGPLRIFAMLKASLSVSWKHYTCSSLELSDDELYVTEQLKLMNENMVFVLYFVSFFLSLLAYVLHELRANYLGNDYSFLAEFQVNILPASPTAMLMTLRTIMDYVWVYLEDDFKNSGSVVNEWPLMLSAAGWDPATVAATANSSFLLFIEAGEIVGDHWRTCLNESFSSGREPKVQRHMLTDLLRAKDIQPSALSRANCVDLWLADFLFYSIHTTEGLHGLFRLSILIPAVYLGLFYTMYVAKWNAAHEKEPMEQTSELTQLRQHRAELCESTLAGVHANVQDDYSHPVEDISGRTARHHPRGKPAYLWRARCWCAFSSHAHYFFPLALTLAWFLFQHLMVQQLIYYHPKDSLEESALYLYEKIVPFDHLLVSMIAFQLADAMEDIKPARLPFESSLMWYFFNFFWRRYSKTTILVQLDRVFGAASVTKNVVALILAVLASCAHVWRRELLTRESPAGEAAREGWLWSGYHFVRSKLVMMGQFFNKPWAHLYQLCVWKALFYTWLYFTFKHRTQILTYMRYDFRYDLITTVVSWGALFAVVDMQMIFPIFAMLAESLDTLNLQLGTNIINYYDDAIEH